MAVTMTTQFYQDSAWKDISKIVFTSPNMTSPNTAGTRSHILPGEGDLGLWYEDTTNMYRVEPSQEETVTDFYGYTTKLQDDAVLSGTIDHLDVYDSNYDGIETYIQESAGVTPIDYVDITVNMIASQVKLEYTLIDEGLELITDTLGQEQEYIIEQSTRKCLVIVSKRLVDVQ